jgi:hypothetical protein
MHYKGAVSLGALVLQPKSIGRAPTGAGALVFYIAPPPSSSNLSLLCLLSSSLILSHGSICHFHPPPHGLNQLHELVPRSRRVCMSFPLVNFLAFPFFG